MGQSFKQSFEAFLKADSTAKSNKTGAYCHALDMLGGILAAGESPFARINNVWNVVSPEELMRLYHFLKAEQKRQNGGIFAGVANQSYWKHRFYSTAVKSLAMFRVVEAREQSMLAAVAAGSGNGAALAGELEKMKLAHSDVFLDEGVKVSSAEGRDALRAVKVRLNQSVFRKMIVGLYGGRCCVCGLNVPEVLRASHIVGWAEDMANRMNPENGLCLSATYDAAFDKHLISFDEQYRMVFAPSLKGYSSNEAFQSYFKPFEGRRLSLPQRYLPSQELLAAHRGQMK